MDFVRKYFFSSIPITIKDVDTRKEIGRSTSSSLELLSMLGRETAKPIYIVGKQYIELQENEMYGRRYISPDKESVLFYNKGIWIKEMFYVA